MLYFIDIYVLRRGCAATASGGGQERVTMWGESLLNYDG